MKATPGNAPPIQIPQPGDERELAMRLYSARTPLYLQILDEVARQRGLRYNDLLILIPKGTSKNRLTKALHRLQLEGALTKRGMGETAGYELTPHGVAVRDAIVEYRAINRMRQDTPEPRSAPATTA